MEMYLQDDMLFPRHAIQPWAVYTVLVARTCDVIVCKTEPARIGIHAKTLTEILLEGQVHIDRSFVNELVWIFLLRGFTRTLSLDSRTL